jgi:hypothetical protein
MILVAVLLACNNEGTESTSSDTAVIQEPQDNTTNADTAMRNDTTNLRDTANRSPR